MPADPGTPPGGPRCPTSVCPRCEHRQVPKAGTAQPHHSTFFFPFLTTSFHRRNVFLTAQVNSFQHILKTYIVSLVESVFVRSVLFNPNSRRQPHREQSSVSALPELHQSEDLPALSCTLYYRQTSNSAGALGFIFFLQI